MTAQDLKAALVTLGWTQRRAAQALGVSSEARVSEWVNGRRQIPQYVAEHVRTHLELRKCEDGYIRGQEDPDTSIERDPGRS